MDINEAIRALTDDELREKLIENGIQAGPVVASTRRFYENKLLKILGHNEVDKPSYPPMEEGEDDYGIGDHHQEINIIRESPAKHVVRESPEKSGPSSNFLGHSASSSGAPIYPTLSEWSSSEMRRRPLRDIDNFEYESPHLKKRFEVAPDETDETNYLPSRYQIKTTKLQHQQDLINAASGERFGRLEKNSLLNPPHARNPARTFTNSQQGQNSINHAKRFMFLAIMVALGLLIFFTIIPRVNEGDSDENPIPKFD